MLEFDKLVNEIDKDIRNEPNGHSEFQIRNFIIGSQPTIYGKYKQCVLELRSRIKNYKSIMNMYNKLKAKEKLSSDEVKQMSEYEICLEDIKRETYIISDLYKEIKENINLDNRDELEIEYWDEKFGKEVTAHKISGYPLPVSLIQNILSLPNICRVKQLLVEQIIDSKEIKNDSTRSITDKSR
jgi:hypothetical protein